MPSELEPNLFLCNLKKWSLWLCPQDFQVDSPTIYHQWFCIWDINVRRLVLGLVLLCSLCVLTKAWPPQCLTLAVLGPVLSLLRFFERIRLRQSYLAFQTSSLPLCRSSYLSQLRRSCGIPADALFVTTLAYSALLVLKPLRRWHSLQGSTSNSRYRQRERTEKGDVD